MIDNDRHIIFQNILYEAITGGIYKVMDGWQTREAILKDAINIRHTLIIGLIFLLEAILFAFFDIATESERLEERERERPGSRTRGGGDHGYLSCCHRQRVRAASMESALHPRSRHWSSGPSSLSAHQYHKHIN